MVRDGNYTYQGERFVMYIIVESLCHTPETNDNMSIILQ